MQGLLWVQLMIMANSSIDTVSMDVGANLARSDVLDTRKQGNDCCWPGTGLESPFSGLCPVLPAPADRDRDRDRQRERETET